MSTEAKYIGYVRVSTKHQGASGLGLDAQVDAIERFVESREGELLGVYQEIESGRAKNRPVLAEAIAAAKGHGAVLLIAKLDRLTRNVLFMATLQRSEVRFTACDMPDANELTINIMAAMAQHEAELISKRTKAALAVARERGSKLGNPRLREFADKARAGKAKVHAAQTAEARGYLRKLAELMPSGFTVREGVSLLEAAGIVREDGTSWGKHSVWDMMRREGLIVGARKL